ncbi:CHAT domain-containing protein [Actinoplanes sp. G11-F43]|uniref:CHAT domain-containing protein n=1 Tax=Actinoplanes sp. G11-F43 TaxID=3424130 RepID=UPI003D333632
MDEDDGAAAAAEFQRVLDALATGRPGVGPDDLTAAIDRLAGHANDDVIAALRLAAEPLTAYHHRDVAALTGLPERMAALRTRLPADSPESALIEKYIEMAGFLAEGTLQPGAVPSIPGALPEPVRRGLAMLATEEAVSPRAIHRLRRDVTLMELTPMERANLFAQLGMISVRQGHPLMRRLAISDFRTAVRHAVEGDPFRPYYLLMLADALLDRAEDTLRAPGPLARMIIRTSVRPGAGALRDVAAGIGHLEQARDLAGWAGHPHWAMICMRLGLGHRLAGHDAAAREAGTAALRGHMWQVLMQAHTAAASAVVGWAAVDALLVAGWHSGDGDADGAAAALEAGRALILHAATETRDVPRQLAAAGLDDLAGRWAALPEGLDAKPAALRRAVFEQLVEPRRLLDPPSGAGIRAALTTVGADALIYLVPEDDLVGHAVIVPAAGPAEFVELPGLTDPPRIAIITTDGRDLGDPELHDDQDWAWRVAMGPLLDGYFAGRDPRLVLIPMGRLGTVAWHAARSGETYAIERATISYIPSARMLCRAATAAISTAGPALIVGDPDTGSQAADLPAARIEAQIVHDRFYPHARYIGRPAHTADVDGPGTAGVDGSGTAGVDGSGTAAEVEDWLADDTETGGVLHLACHGGVDGDQAYLLLDGGDRLSADRLAEATRNGRRPALVVLAACRSAVSGRGWDEAFSLAATFLAAGAGAVVAAQWNLPDRATSDLMVSFHGNIAQGDHPADALRKAQPSALHRPVTDWAGLIHFGR